MTGVSAIGEGVFCITSAYLSSKRTDGKNLVRSITRYCFLLSGEILFGYHGMHHFVSVINPTLRCGVKSILGGHSDHTQKIIGN